MSDMRKKCRREAQTSLSPIRFAKCVEVAAFKENQKSTMWNIVNGHHWKLLSVAFLHLTSINCCLDHQMRIWLE